MKRRVTSKCTVGLAVAALALFFAEQARSELAPIESCCPDCVVVALDLDADTPGFQTTLEVPEGTLFVRDVGIWIFDPAGTNWLHSIGFAGGLDRALAFGHVPEASFHSGQVAALIATALEPVIPDSVGFISCCTLPVFSPEIQYLETPEDPFLPGGGGVISASPSAPAIKLDIELTNATSGDVYRFFLADLTANWQSGFGAFSTSQSNSLESGGDACPDGTPTGVALDGSMLLDGDVAVSIPPAVYGVDYIDSPPGGGGAMISVPEPSPEAQSLIVLLLVGLHALVFSRSVAR